MVGLILTGHGSFATGLISSLELIAGSAEKLIGVDFTSEDNTETLEVKIKAAIEELGDDIVVLSDLVGGSPFKVSVMLGQKMEGKNIRVIAGTNLGMLLETSLCRGEMSVDELVEFALNSGTNAIKIFEVKAQEVEEIDDEFDGI